MKGTTKSGFEFEIKEEALDDYELLELIHEADKGSTGSLIDVINKMLGKGQCDRLKEHLRVDGKISATRMFAEVREIFNLCRAVKN